MAVVPIEAAVGAANDLQQTRQTIDKSWVRERSRRVKRSANLPLAANALIPDDALRPLIPRLRDRLREL
jgi:hypothetical protein